APIHRVGSGLEPHHFHRPETRRRFAGLGRAWFSGKACERNGCIRRLPAKDGLARWTRDVLSSPWRVAHVEGHSSRGGAFPDFSGGGSRRRIFASTVSAHRLAVVLGYAYSGDRPRASGGAGLG